MSLFTHGIEVEGSRDVAGRPTARRTFKKSLAAAAMGFAVGMLATPSYAQPAREEVDARVYQWRGEDQIAGIVDAASGPKFYDHDGRGRLVRERRPDAVVERAMDAVGNVYRSRTGTDRRYGPGGRLEMADGIRYEHDEDGNQTLKSGPDGDWLYRWNGHGMLREVERPDGVRVAFDYDPFARRTAKRTLSAAGTVDQEVQFVWDGHNVIHELDSDRGLISWQWEPESFTPIAKEHAGRRWTIASDHLGTPTEMYDDLGRLAWKMQLDVFGVPRFAAGSAEDCPWRWPGQYEDGGTELLYNRFRWLSQSTSRFMSNDPLRLRNGPGLAQYVPDPATGFDALGLYFGRTTRVGYWDNAYQDELTAAYRTGDATANIAHVNGNVAVLELADGSRHSFASAAGDHSEELMIRFMRDNAISPAEVRTIYTELSPCAERCLPALREFLGDSAHNVELQFTWFHGADRAVYRERYHAQRTRAGC